MATRFAIKRQPHVCIVGAGVAGLRCADILLQQGIKVTIYEARNRIGGRIQQTNIRGHTIDIGPNWIHGTDDNPILDIANETKSIACSVGEVSETFDEHGQVIKRSKSNELSELMWGIIADAFKYSNGSPDISPNKSLRDFFVEQLAEKDLSSANKKLLLQMSELWGGFVGDHVEHQSLKYFWLEECIDGENLFLSSTYKAILNRIAEPALKGATLHLSTPILSIDTSKHTDTEPEVSVRTFLGEVHSFDAVVLTVPLGLLKLSLPTLMPALPPRLSSAVKNISYGRLEKAFVSFDTAFWDKPGRALEVQHAERPANPVFRHFLHPLYTPSNPGSYDIAMMSLHSLPRGITHPTLLFYIHGDFATQVVSRLSSLEPGSEDYNSTLESILSPYYSRLSNYDTDAPECKPRAFYATSWQRDEHAGYGSYTNFQIPNPPVEEGSEDYPHLDKDIEALRHGLPERGLWLAGEHTAPFIALGTVTGAYWSGEAVGKRIATWFEGKENNDMPDGHAEQSSTVQVGKGGKEGVTGVEL